MKGRIFLLQLFHAEDLSFGKVFHLVEQMFYRATAASVGQKRYMEGLPMRGRAFSSQFRAEWIIADLYRRCVGKVTYLQQFLAFIEEGGEDAYREQLWLYRCFFANIVQS